MVVGHQARPAPGAGPQPALFTSAAASMNAARLRPEIESEPMPAPQRIAPYATALSADVVVDDEDLGTGRLILLHDPDGNQAWGGEFRFVAYARAEIDPALVVDPLLGEVGWSWLTDALSAHGAAYTAASGTVTRVAVENFGAMADEERSAQLEVRASWTPEVPDSGDVRAHVEAWGELLCTSVGLEPVPDGVTSMSSRRPGGSAS
ncbi:DUF3000 domain-containing protein [Nocardioides sp. Bht2]|uniref:DUF3000 domain-containing protein n=1 Tax=Nocardioides sp. Bht2 TaxID=3392297 RepID=UPI0039B6CC7A